MASKSPKNDFAPAWLKIPAGDASVSVSISKCLWFAQFAGVLRGFQTRQNLVISRLSDDIGSPVHPTDRLEVWVMGWHFLVYKVRQVGNSEIPDFTPPPHTHILTKMRKA